MKLVIRNSATLNIIRSLYIQIVVLAETLCSVKRIHSSSSIKNKMLPLFGWKGSSVINLPAGSWLITLWNGIIWGSQCWSLELVDWVSSSDHRQFSLGEGQYMWLVLCLISISAIMATLFRSPPGDDRGEWGKRQICIHWEVILFTWLLKSSSVEVGHRWTANKHLQIFVHIFVHFEWTKKSTCLFPSLPCHQSSNLILSMDVSLSRYTIGQSPWVRL